MTPCHCTGQSPTLNVPYTVAKARAEELHKQGLVQVRCRDCGRYSLWIHRSTGLPPTRREYAIDDIGY